MEAFAIAPPTSGLISLAPVIAILVTAFVGAAFAARQYQRGLANQGASDPDGSGQGKLAGAWVLPLIPIVMLTLILGMMAIVMARVPQTRFFVSREGLRLRVSDGRLIRASRLVPSRVSRVDLSGDSPFRPVRRTNGIGLQNYDDGWFRLANGERVLAYMTDRSRAVYIPTTEGYAVLVTPADPDKFVAAVRRLETP